MEHLKWVKIVLTILLAGAAMTLLLGPANATVPGADIRFNGSLGGGSPDVKVSSNGQFVAVAYFKQSSGAGNIYLKSGTATNGWLTAKFLGRGTSPRLAFKGNNTVFVVWASSDNRAIKFARCTLSATALPACNLTGDIFTVSPNPDLATPAVLVDGNGNIHVAWQNLNQIQTAVSTNASNGQGWTPAAPLIPPPGSTYKAPELAWTATSNFVHLAFVREPALSGEKNQIVEYRRSNSPIFVDWNGRVESFEIGSEISDSYDEVNNPTLAATGSTVYLVWDAHRANGVGDQVDEFGLMRALSTDQGGTWSLTHVTSEQPASILDSGSLRISRSRDRGAIVPLQEEGLRPSLTLSGSTFALTWQERPEPGCPEEGNGSSQINVAYTTTTWSTDVLGSDSTEYAIDPVLGVGPGGVRHFVFMKDTNVLGCSGGAAPDYAVYYRGPIITQTLDQGEEPGDDDGGNGGGGGGGGGGSDVYLPSLTKE